VAPRGASREPFGPLYYRRFYGAKRTRIHGEEEVARLGAALVAVINWYGGPLRSVLEIGAGVGLLRDWFRVEHPEVAYVSTEYSEHAAAEYGHERRDIATWRGRRRFDLVVCQGVLPYLSDRDASRAIATLAAMSRGFLYLEAITRKDGRLASDTSRTDPAMRLRTAAFYRTRLARHYQALGGGLFYAKAGPRVFWELETL